MVDNKYYYWTGTYAEAACTVKGELNDASTVVTFTFTPAFGGNANISPAEWIAYPNPQD